MTDWVRIRSWHAIATIGVNTVTGRVSYLTACGREPGADREVSNDLPAGKSCETCLRYLARQNDVA